jgi:hypothetical protein
MATMHIEPILVPAAGKRGVPVVQLAAAQLRTINRLRQLLGEDVEEVLLVLAIVVAVMDYPAGRITSSFSGEIEPFLVAGPASNLSSLAAAAGLPRETARRKLGALIDKGMIRKGGGRSYGLTRDLAQRLRLLSTLQSCGRDLTRLVAE